MEYIYDYLNDIYIISLNDSIDNEEYQNIINEISMNEMRQGNMVCHTYFNTDFTHCIIDFKRNKINQETVDFLAESCRRRNK